MTPALRVAITRIAMNARLDWASLGKAYSSPALMFGEDVADEVRRALETVLGEPESESGANGPHILRTYGWPAIRLHVVRWAQDEAVAA